MKRLRKKKIILFHRLICSQYRQVDHINRLRLDNCEKNLREGFRINQKNQSLRKDNKSGFNGIRIMKQGNKKYKVDWCENRKHKQKYFYSMESAVEFRKILNIRLEITNGEKLNYNV